MDKKRQSFSLKFVVVGDPMVGKTSLILAFARKFFSATDPPESTSLTEKFCQELTVDEVKMLISLWDTPSMDGYENIRTRIYPQTNCFIVCYAVGNPSSFANIENYWLPEIYEICPDAVVILAGTKSDLENKASQQYVSEETVAELVGKYRLEGSRQCSSKSIESVEKVFVDAIEALSLTKH